MPWDFSAVMPVIGNNTATMALLHMPFRPKASSTFSAHQEIGNHVGEPSFRFSILSFVRRGQGEVEASIATEGQIFLCPSRCVQIQDSTPPQSSPYKGEDAKVFFLPDNLRDD
jgi:hypothetical protein